MPQKYRAPHTGSPAPYALWTLNYPAELRAITGLIIGFLKDMTIRSISVRSSGGGDGIRTHGKALGPYNGLANRYPKNRTALKAP